MDTHSGLTQDQVDKLVNAFGRHLPREIRNRVVLRLIAQYGLRPREVRALRMDQVRDEGLFQYLQLDNRKVPLAPGAWEELTEWLKLRESFNTRCPYVFCTLRPGRIGRPLHDSYLRRCVKLAVRRAGLPTEINATALREFALCSALGDSLKLFGVPRPQVLRDAASTLAERLVDATRWLSLDVPRTIAAEGVG